MVFLNALNTGKTVRQSLSCVRLSVILGSVEIKSIRGALMKILQLLGHLCLGRVKR